MYFTIIIDADNTLISGCGVFSRRRRQSIPIHEMSVSHVGGPVFGFILIFAITLMHMYVFWRAASVPVLKRHVPRKFLIGAGLVLWATFFLGSV